MSIEDIVDINSAENYIYENFILDGTSQQFVSGVLYWVRDKYRGNVADALFNLLDPVGLNCKEIEKIASVI